MLSAIVERHIALHHATGYAFRTQGNLLRDFGRFADSRRETFVVAASAISWASRGREAVTRRTRLAVVARFARLVRAEDPRHQVPPRDVFGPRPLRRTPFIFSKKDLGALLVAAGSLEPRGSLRPRTYTTLFGLIAATGLRISEALALRVDDISPAGLVVRQTKFRKSRLVPLHASTRRALDSYLARRQRSAGDDASVFLSTRGTGIRYPSVISTFLSLMRGLGLHPGVGKPGPRIHDLRHTFAVRSLERCAGCSGEEVARHMLALSTYLGHAHVFDTYWYLQATPALLGSIASRCEALATGARQ